MAVKHTQTQKASQIQGEKSRAPKPAVDAALETAPAIAFSEARLAPSALTPRKVLRLQRAVGNRAVGSLVRPAVQAKLRVNAPGDPYEQEADRVADLVVRTLPTSPISSTPSAVRRQAGEDEEEAVMPALAASRAPESGPFAVSDDVESAIQGAQGGGNALAQGVRQPMERAFGSDFGGVRVHTDAQSDQLNRSVEARAFTTGQDIFFRQGEYHPGDAEGRRLLAHELTHVVQQSGAAPRISREGGKGEESKSMPHPLQNVLGVHLFRVLRGALSQKDPKVYQILNALSSACLRVLVPESPTSEEDAQAPKQRIVDVITNIGLESAEQISGLVVSLHEHAGIAPGAILSAVGTHAPFLVQHTGPGTMREALWAAQQEGDPAAIFTYISPYLGNVEQLALAKETLSRLDNDVGAATKKMAALAKYNFDPKFLAWAEESAEGVAEEKYEEAREEAGKSKAEAYEHAKTHVSDTGWKKYRKNSRKKPRGFGQYEKGIREADEEERRALETAEARKPEWKREAMIGYEDFIARAGSKKVSPEHTQWILRSVQGNTAMADGLLALFTNTAIDAPLPVAQWLLELSTANKNATSLQKAVRLVELALSKGLTDTTSQGPVAFALEHNAPAEALLTQVAREPDEWPQVQQFLEAHSSDLAAALSVLEKARGVPIDLKTLAAFSEKRDIKTLQWAFGKSTDLAEVKTMLDSLLPVVETTQKLDKLLENARVEELEKLLDVVDYDEPNPKRLQSLLDKATGAQLLQIVEPGSKFSADKAETYLVGKSIDPEHLIALLGKADATGTKISSLLTWTGHDAALLLALYDRGLTTAQLDTLSSSYIGGDPESKGDVGDPNGLKRVGDAYLSQSDWDKGTFPDAIRSILYHYEKHVKTENGAVTPPGTIVEYTDDAKNLYAGSGPGVAQTDGSYFVGAHGAPGGYFTSGGKVLTYWYH